MLITENIELLPHYEDSFLSEEDKDEEKDKKEETKDKEDKEDKENPEENKEEEMTGAEGEDEFSADDDFGEEESLDLSDLGKVYQLKRIYHTLTGLYDIAFDLLPYDTKLKNYIILLKKTLDYYKMIIFNIKLYKDKLDGIIKNLNKFADLSLKYLNYKVDKIKEMKKSQQKDLSDNINNNEEVINNE